MRTSTLSFIAAAAAPALAQQPAWAQCGGIGYTGSTTCVSGYSCNFVNDWYSQCVPGTAATPTTLKTSATSRPGPSSTPTPTPGGGSNPWWFGINLSGAEFGEKEIPGIYGKHYTWYDKAAIDTLLSKGVNMLRVNFLMERLTPTLTGGFDANYLSNLTATINYITQKGAHAMVQPHNYGRFNGAIITDVSGFKTWWKNVAAQYKNNNLVIFDTNNEFHDMDQSLVVNLNQAAIDGIREAGATSQWITPEGNAWTGAWSWVSPSSNGATMGSLKDPQNKLIFQMHQYLDSDSSGTHEECVSSTIFRERLQAATNWLRSNKKLGLIGEFAGGNNAQCIAALQDGLDFLRKNKDVWTGHTWWSAGPWWSTYMYNMEPPSGVSYVNVLPKLMNYVK